MKLDGVYYPLNDSISWLTACMEEMKQDIARIQNATDTARPPSIDRRQPQSTDSRRPPSIDRHHHTSIDNRLTASLDTIPPRPHPMKSQPDFHTREEIDQLVEAIQGELVEIQSYISHRPEAALSIDRCNNKQIDIHNQTSIDSDKNRGRVVPKMISDMSNTPYRREEISADTYAALTRHQFNLESLGERLQRIENTTAAMKDKWRRGDEALRDFTGTWFNKRKEEMDTCFPERDGHGLSVEVTSSLLDNDRLPEAMDTPQRWFATHDTGDGHGLSVEVTSSLLDNDRLPEAMDTPQRWFATHDTVPMDLIKCWRASFCALNLDLVIGPVQQLAKF
ncbi:hypothetical protein F2Q69_00012615 [Brassica cretica]|uniref:Uncharacterized protein n=1 Tax=Brassica cretica TaxID=69181 RepID=A0A8S9R967_BRACR|nr:hypothetical protein F2Q69_00012615 [Brassica cretica]